MSTPITIDIATKMHTALTTAVDGAAYVYARGVKTDSDGVAASGDIDIERKCPMVDIIPAERRPQQHNSALQAYPVRVRVITYGPDDPWQVTLYTIADVVGEYLVTPPALVLTSCEFDALVVDEAPDVGELGQNGTLQYMEWTTTVRVRRTS